MTATLTLWIVIVAVGGLTYLSRLSFIALYARWDMPPFVARALRFVPAAMLTAIVVPVVALSGSGADPALDHEKLAAALLASLVAWRTRSPAATMVAGMAALWLLRFIPRRLERIDKSFRPMIEDKFHHGMGLLQGATMPAAPQGRLLSALLWNGPLPSQRISCAGLMAAPFRLSKRSRCASIRRRVAGSDSWLTRPCPPRRCRRTGAP